jgi:hypothetical protein
METSFISGSQRRRCRFLYLRSVVSSNTNCNKYPDNVMLVPSSTLNTPNFNPEFHSRNTCFYGLRIFLQAYYKIGTDHMDNIGRVIKTISPAP